MKTVTRSATEGGDSRRFHSPFALDVFRFGGRINLRRQGDDPDRTIHLWPDEAIELGLALIQKATEEQVFRALDIGGGVE